MDLSGAGAKAVVALLLYGPLTLEQLVGNSGVSRRSLWAGVAQAEKLGLVTKEKRGRATLYSFSLLPTTLSGLSSVESRKEDDKDSSSNIYPYRGSLGAKTSPQSAKTSPYPNEHGAKTSPYPRHGEEIAPQSEEIAPSQSDVLGEEIAPSPLDLIVVADQMPQGHSNGQHASPSVLRRAAQREAISALWTDLLPTKPIPPRATLDRLLLEANNSAYFLGVVIQDMTATGKDIEWPLGYISKVIKARKERGDLPRVPLGEVEATEALTPELRAYFERAETEGQSYWGSDDE